MILNKLHLFYATFVARINTCSTFDHQRNSNQLKPLPMTSAIETKKMLPVSNFEMAIDATPIRETEKAIFVEVVNTRTGSFMTTWIPKSVVKFTTESVEIADWFMSKTFSSFLNGYSPKHFSN